MKKICLYAASLFIIYYCGVFEVQGVYKRQSFAPVNWTEYYRSLHRQKGRRDHLASNLTKGVKRRPGSSGRFAISPGSPNITGNQSDADDDLIMNLNDSTAATPTTITATPNTPASTTEKTYSTSTTTETTILYLNNSTTAIPATTTPDMTTPASTTTEKTYPTSTTTETTMTTTMESTTSASTVAPTLRSSHSIINGTAIPEKGKIKKPSFLSRIHISPMSCVFLLLAFACISLFSLLCYVYGCT